MKGREVWGGLLEVWEVWVSVFEFVGFVEGEGLVCVGFLWVLE